MSASSTKQASGTSPTTPAAKPKVPSKPMFCGFRELPDGSFVCKKRQSLLDYAKAFWKCGDNELDLSGPHPKSRLFLVKKKVEAPPAEPVETEVRVVKPPAMTAEAVRQLITHAIANREAIAGAGPVILGLGKLPPAKWYEKLVGDGDLSDEKFKVQGDRQIAIIMAVLYHVGATLKGSKRSEALLGFVDGVPDDLRQTAAHLLGGAYVTFDLLKKT